MVKLLIVEDNDFERNALLNYINWDILGIRQVEAAFNGLDGLQKARELQPDIVISDVKMPGLSGMEMAKGIAGFCPQAKFIFSSGHEEVGLLQEAMEVRAYSYLVKPLKQEELIAVIKRITSILVDEKLANHETARMIEQFKQHLPYLQSRFLEELIVSDAGSRDDRSLVVQANDLKLRMIGMYKLAWIEFDFGPDSDLFHQSNVIQVMLYKLENRFANQQVVFIKKSSRGILALLHTLIQGQGEGAGIITGIQQELEAISRENPCSYFISVSELFANLNELHLAFRQTSRAAARKIRMGYGQIAYYTQDPEPQSSSWDSEPKDTPVSLASIIDRVCEGDYGDEDLSRLVQWILADPDPAMESIQSRFILLFSTLSMQLANRGERLDKIAEEEGKIYQTVIKSKTIPDLIQYTGKNLKSVSSYMARKKLNKDDYVIKEILHILNHEYRKPITLSYLSERVYLSPNYLRILFKEKMKISIQEYLTNLRMCKAKELLKETRHKVHEIGEMVGYENSTYFNIVFKNYIQMTPGEYRNKYASIEPGEA
ncbi:response regulator transcription factor [Gorillibacterium sp. sgz5001074]|uniref:response regulator transcription factor n=1 Tax=Gorillibacterium sp. sgz5001074 TaxID=3446695 RepID=UPI003F67BD73